MNDQFDTPSRIATGSKERPAQTATSGASNHARDFDDERIIDEEARESAMSRSDNSPTASVEFQGEYSRQQGDGRRYKYFASLFPTAEGYRWTAEVWSHGKFKGTPSGKIGFRSLGMAEVRVGDKILRCIENLDGVAE